MWTNVVDILEQNNNIAQTVELQCPCHPDTPIAVTGPDDFHRLSPEGGCNLQGAKRLTCGYACLQKCHSDLLHSTVFCLEPCTSPQKGCTHPCPKKCGDDFPKRCFVNIFQADSVLNCGHLMQDLPCWQHQDISTVVCKVPVEKVVPGCNHAIRMHAMLMWSQLTTDA